MKKSIYSLFILLLITLFISCEDDNLLGNGWQPTEENQAKSFVWKSMNSWYYWQSDVPQLGDNYFSSNEAYNSYLNGFQSPYDVFADVKYSQDRFSWIDGNYQNLINQLQGITLSYGMDYGLVRINSSDELFGYIHYVIPNSPASQAGLTRGLVFRQINGTNLTLSNYRTLLSEVTITLGFADYNSGNITLNGNTTNLTATQIVENPIYYSNTYEIATKKVGYLVYNAFHGNYNAQLNAVFGQFQNQNITDFVLDLRYNSGGLVDNSAMLGSLINGSLNGNIYTQLRFNYKHQDRNKTYTFSNNYNNTPLNSLNMSTVYILTSKSSASASELLINSLKPYMNVVLIGTQTTGKNMGSVTLFDSPSTEYISSNYRNRTHTFALQPLCFKAFNSQNESFSDTGFVPNYEVREIDYLDNLPALGNTTEPLLYKAISLITGIPTQPEIPLSIQQNQEIATEQSFNRLANEMYIEIF